MNINVTFREEQNNLDMSVKETDIFGVGFGSGGGTTDYNKLRHKPTINGVTLEGNKTSEELGLLTEDDLADAVDPIKEELDTKAPVVTKTNGADFYDGADMPMKSLVVNIEPVQAGTGDPSPTNIRPITGWTGMDGSVVGKNWLPNNLTFTNGLRNDTGAQTASSASHYSEPFLIRPNTLYRASGTIWISGTNPRIYFLDANKNWISRTDQFSQRTFTFTTPENCCYIQVQCSKDVDCTAGMISLDQSAAVTPYNGNTFSISWETEAGTVYSGTVDPIKGTLTVDRVAIDMSTLAVNYDSTYSFFSVTPPNILTPLVSATNVLSSCYKSNSGISDSAMATAEAGMYIVLSNGKIKIKDSRYTSASAFRAGNAGQTLCYPITNPQTYQLTPTEIRSLLGENHVTVDAGSIESLVYCVDTAAIIERIDEDLAALDGRVDTLEDEMDTAQDDITSLETAVDKKAPAIYNTASGDIASFADGADGMPIKSLVANIEPVQDLHGYDYPWPEGGGVNKLPPCVPGTYTSENCTAVVASDGTITLSGTSGSNSENIYIPLTEVCTSPSTEYYIHVLNSNVQTGVSLNIEKASDVGNTNINAGLNVANRISAQTKLSVELDRVRFWISSGQTISGTVHPMICLDNTVRTFAPYSNICPISGWTGAEVTRTGKNLIGWAPGVQRTSAGVQYTVNSDGSISCVGTSTGTTWGPGDTQQVLLKAGIYYVGLDGFQSIRVVIVNDSGSTPIPMYPVNNILTLDKDTLIHAYLTGKGNTTYNETVYFKLYLASENHEYEPYTGNQISVTFPDEAGTVYGGTLTLNPNRTGTLVVDKRYITIDENTRMGKEPTGWAQNYEAFYLNIAGNNGKNVGTSSIPNIVSNQLASVSYNTLRSSNGKAFSIAFTANGSYIEWLSTSATVEEEKARITNNPIEVCYELAAPTTYQLTESEISGILSTLYGTNNIWTDVGTIDVEYLADTKLYIEQLTKPTEDDMTANANIAANKFFMIGNTLYFSTAAIAAGATIIPGTNCNVVSLADALNNLNS